MSYTTALELKNRSSFPSHSSKVQRTFKATGEGVLMYNYTNSCFVRLLIVNPRKHDLSVLQRKLMDKQICELKTLRGLGRLSDVRGSLGGAEGLSACADQNCAQTRGRDHDGGASPVCGRRAVPPHLSLG